MKAVLISIKPKWVEKIANCEKTIEVRKTRPKLLLPFKCYIYCTEENKHYDLYINEAKAREDYGYISRLRAGQKEVIKTIDGFNTFIAHGKVIGEFVCDNIEDFSKWEYDYPSLLRHINLYAGTNGDYKFLDYYLNGQKKGYGWHISNLKIYDKPKELSEFKAECPTKNKINGDCGFCKYTTFSHYGNRPKCNAYLKRPPQSWCYVEDIGD